MTRWQQTWEVARWEFTRFVKWKQQIIGFAVILVLGFGGGVLGRMAKSNQQKPRAVAVIGGELLGFALPEVKRIAWDTTEVWTLETARAALADERLSGVLVVSSALEMELLMRKQAEWAETLESALVEARQRTLLARLAAASPDGAALLTPLAMRTTLTMAGARSTSASTRVTAIVFLFFGFTLVMGGFGTLFSGITGEKQQRVTEQLVAIVPPQVWMDGKIIGLTGAACVGTIVTTIGLVTVLKVLPLALGRGSIQLPAVASDIAVLSLIALITLLGVLLWYSVMAAIAATIDDPNSSTRTLLLFAPMLPIMLGFSLTSELDSNIARVFGVFPLTSSAVMPMRLAVTAVPWWEVVFSLGLLVLTALLFRRLAGKVFGAGMLMYGKEPNLREMWRWMRQS
jgi:ABC-2 type transport system permease protein